MASYDGVSSRDVCEYIVPKLHRWGKASFGHLVARSNIHRMGEQRFTSDTLVPVFEMNLLTRHKASFNTFLGSNSQYVIGSAADLEQPFEDLLGA